VCGILKPGFAARILEGDCHVFSTTRCGTGEPALLAEFLICPTAEYANDFGFDDDM
jgi:hypothetical protein